MKRTLLASEKGISLLRILLILVVLIIILPVLYNMISRRVTLPPFLPPLVEDFLTRAIARTRDLKETVEEIKERAGGSLRRAIVASRERWVELTERVPPLSPEVGGDWAADMERLVDLAEENNFNMDEVRALIERFKRESGPDWWRGSNWWRVEKTFWQTLEDQTLEEIRRSFNVFQARPLGCSDFTPLVQRVESLVSKFNEHTLEGYIAAKQAAIQLREFRVEDSKEFTSELLTYLTKSGQYVPVAEKDGDGLQKMMLDAIDKSKPPRYPAIIEQIDLRSNLSNNLLQRAFANTVVAEIYLNYDLIRPAEDRYEEAIRALTKQVQFLPNSIDLHMALGLLHERVCKNTDLAVKEFKDVVALARQANLECEYAVSHFHLGLLYLNIRPRPVVEVTPLPPTPGIPVPTRPPGPTVPPPPEGEERRPERRGVAPERIPERRPERPRFIQRNVRPRQRIPEAKGILFRDFAAISVDSAREFEEFLACQAQGVQARNAEFFHQRYMELTRTTRRE